MPKVWKERTEALGGAVGRAQIRPVVLAGGRLLHPSPWGGQRVFSKQMVQLDFCPSKFCHTDALTTLRSFSPGNRTPSPSSWRRKWQPTPVLLAGKFRGWRSLVGFSPWGRKESDTTERLYFSYLLSLIVPPQVMSVSL